MSDDLTDELRELAYAYEHFVDVDVSRLLATAADAIAALTAERDGYRHAYNMAHAEAIAYLIGMMEGLKQEVPTFITAAHAEWHASLAAVPEGETNE